MLIALVELFDANAPHAPWTPPVNVAMAPAITGHAPPGEELEGASAFPLRSTI